MLRQLAFFVSLAVLITTSSSVFSQKTSAHQLHELSITKANELLNSGQLTSVELVNYYLSRINNYDKNGLTINSVAQVNKQALAIAKQLDEERSQGYVRGPLHGIPVMLKDNIDTHDGMANTGGSIALKNNFPKDDAFLVAKLRKAGAIILGKTNLSEWANFRSTTSSSGWSGLWGQTKNPYDITKSTCGSSAGSGAAVSANFTLLAIGTETDGSITCPSSINGIVGIKPSLGTVSRDGIIPISHSQDTAGPMAKTVTDAVLLLTAMNGFDKNDPAPIKATKNLAKHLKLDGLKGKRIGVVRNLMGYDKGLDSVFEQSLITMKKQGAIIVDNTNIPNREAAGGHEFTVLLYEFKHGLNRYLKDANSPLTLEKLIAFNQQYKQQEMPHFGQEIFELAQAKGDLTDKAYLDAQREAKRLMGRDGIDAVLATHHLDLLIAPSNQPAWKIDWKNGDDYKGAASSPAAIAGYPHITVPMGFVGKLPVGMSFFGANLSEAILVEAAYGFEQATKKRKPPTL